jgi:hypothetical protein
MLIPSSGSTSSAVFSDSQLAYICPQQHKPLTCSLKREAANSFDMFVCISKTIWYQDTSENNLHKNKLFVIDYIKLRFATGFPPIDGPFFL